MGRCSYTWEGWDKEKGKHVEECCQKETWKGSDEFCIFHDPSPEKDVDLFREMLKEQIQSETVRHNFIGYHFPGEWDFSRKEFRIVTDFEEATFQDANFRGATFQDAHFWGATFQDANFSSATFQNAYFRDATFQSTANFGRTAFQRKVELTLKNNKKLNLRYSEFLFQSYITANLTKCLFHRSIIENVAFINCIWPKKYIIFHEKPQRRRSVSPLFDLMLDLTSIL